MKIDAPLNKSVIILRWITRILGTVKIVSKFRRE